MQKYWSCLLGIGLCLYGLSIHALYAQSTATIKETPDEEWNIHQSKKTQSPETGTLSRYHKKAHLYPSKHGMTNPLRQKGWHTHPDPYTEEGGIYTSSEHPALTDDQSTMREYTSGSPNHYVTPPSTILDLEHSRQSQQKVKIKDPYYGYASPINLPSS